MLCVQTHEGALIGMVARDALIGRVGWLILLLRHVGGATRGAGLVVSGVVERLG